MSATGETDLAGWRGVRTDPAGVEAGEAFAGSEQLRQRIRTYAWTSITGNLVVSTSIGVTTSRLGDSRMPDMLNRTDKNLYADKRGGRDRVVTNAS